MTKLLTSIRNYLILKLAGDNTVLLNASIIQGTVHVVGAHALVRGTHITP